MFRDEKELINSLVKMLSGKTAENCKMTNSENEAIEKYRDKDGFINLTKVKDNNEINRIVKIVDKKNYLESLLAEKDDTQIMADKLADELFALTGADTIDIKINTPNGTDNYYFTSSDTDNDDNTPEDTSNEDKATKDVVITNETPCQTKNESVNIGKRIVLYNVGGNYIPSFYNAVLHICNHEHFAEDGVYSEFGVIPNEVDVCILLPNIWNKIYSNAVEDFAEKVKNGTEVYVINPETFELTQITCAKELWEYEMTAIQEEYL